MNEERMLKGRDKTTGFVQKDSGYALSNSGNNEKTLSTKTQDVILDLERTKGKLETYGQSSVNVRPGIALGVGQQTDNALVTDAIKELMSESIVSLKEKLAMQQDTHTKLNNYLQMAKSIKESSTFASELRNEIMNPGKQDIRPTSKGKKKHEQTVLSNVTQTNPVKLDKVVLAKKESQRKMAPKQLQAKLLPATETLQQQKESKILAKSKPQLIEPKKLTSIKTKQDPKVEQGALVKKSLITQFQHVQADLHSTLEAGLAAGKIGAVTPFYI